MLIKWKGLPFDRGNIELYTNYKPYVDKEFETVIMYVWLWYFNLTTINTLFIYNWSVEKSMESPNNPILKNV